MLVDIAHELESVGAFDAARSCYERALTAGISLALARAELARLSLWEGRISDALAMAESALKEDPSCARALIVRAALQLRSGDFDAAIGNIGVAFRYSPPDPEGCVLRVEVLLRAGRLREAHDALGSADRIFADTSHHVALQLLRWIVASKEGETIRYVPSDSEAVWSGVERLLDREPVTDERGLLRDVEAALERLGSNRSPLPTVVTPDQRLELLEMSESPRTLSKMATWSIQYEDFAVAEAALEELVARFPESHHPHCYRGELRLWQGNYAAARDDFQAALRVCGTGVARWAHIGLGASHLLEGELDVALRAFEDGTTRAEPGPTLFVYRGEARRKLGSVEAALEDLRHASELAPGRVSAWVNLALVHGAVGDTTAWNGAFREVVARAPGLVSDAAHELGLELPRVLRSSTHSQILPLLEHLLVMMRGNRSSSCISYFTRAGDVRFVPPHLDVDQAALQDELARLGASIARARRRPELVRA
jgi:tetratricopeptide (TPR) repeat protein